MSDKTNNEWNLNDIWCGILFLVTGILIALLIYLTAGRGIQLMFVITGWCSGLLFTFLGLNAIIQSIASVWRNGKSTPSQNSIN